MLKDWVSNDEGFLVSVLDKNLRCPDVEGRTFEGFWFREFNERHPDFVHDELRGAVPGDFENIHIFDDIVNLLRV